MRGIPACIAIGGLLVLAACAIFSVPQQGSLGGAVVEYVQTQSKTTAALAAKLLEMDK